MINTAFSSSASGLGSLPNPAAQRPLQIVAGETAVV